MDALCTWLRGLGLERYTAVFADNGVDVNSARLLTDADLEKLGVLLGHRRTLLQAIDALRTTDTRPPLRSPDTYTPKHLAEKILTSKAALEGERKQVTVLFADLRGSMELLADRDPEDARKILDPVLERMMEAVHHYEGTVNQVMGDGIMALFGAPLAHEDHAVRACYAALRMQETVGRYAEGVRRSEGLLVQIRVGLNSGEVVVRAIGSDLHMDYTAVGQTTHLAARMEQLAAPGTTLVSAESLCLAEGYVQVKPLGPVTVKGLPEPVEVYELTGAGQARTRLQAAALRGFTRFVGREAEIEHLRRVLSQAATGHGQVVAIVGEAGVGKSRLTYEFTHSHRVQDWLILEASSVSYGKATSYLPVIDLLKGYFKIGDRDDHREMRAKVLGRVLALDRALEPLLPPLLALLDVPVDDAAWKNLDPPQRRQRILDAVKRMLLRESQAQPLLVVFEDLHWVDGETQALLDSLIESLGSARLLLLVNYRPEYEHRWGSKTAYSQVRLDTLPAESAQELLAALLGADPGLAPLTRMLVKRGNPFFLEETLRTLVETGALVGQHGAYRLTRSVETLRVPATVQTILAARIDRLPQEEKQLLQAASVIGKDLSYALLAAIGERPEQALRRELAHLQEAEFLYETQLFPDLEYTFKHALTHEVTYGSLLQDRRRATHARIVEAIETLHAGRLDEHIEQLGHHAFRGEIWEKAVQYIRHAGARAVDRSANREAAAWFEQALEALSHIPESRQAIEQAIDLRFDLRSALHAQGEFKRILTSLQEAQRLAEVLDDQGRLGRVFGYLALTLAFMGDSAGALAAGHRALDIAEARAEIGLQAGANYSLGLIYCNLGDYRRAMEFNSRLMESLQGELIRERFGLPVFPAVYARHLAMLSLAPLGEFAAAIAHGEDGFRIAEALKHPLSHLYLDMAAGFVNLYRGHLHEAMAVLERGLILCEATGSRLIFGWVASYLGSVYACSGRLSDGVLLLEQGVETITSLKVNLRRSYVIGLLGEAYLYSGRMDDASQCAERALDLSRAQEERGYEAETHRLLGEVAAHRAAPDFQAAEDSYRRAMAIGKELGMRPLLARCHWGLGQLYLRAGDSSTAREQSRAAEDMFREMDMRFWLEKAQTASGPSHGSIP